MNNKPLSEVLVQLRDINNLAFSFNDTELRQYYVTVDRQFESTEEMLSFLLEDLPLSWEKSGDIFVIYTKKKQTHKKNITHTLIGRIVDRNTLEPLPYSSVAINKSGTITDEDGYFSHRSTDSIFNVQVSYLGYYIIDTTLSPEKKHLIKMTASSEQLKEVVIHDRLIESFLYSEDLPGMIRLNHKITKFLPGSSNNSIFNLLRLQTGISATAESSGNLIIWGSYEGQSRILFDDILLFGMKNFNDNIGIVNPLVVKDVKLLKASFGASYGDCVGGIADITGKDGNRKKFSMSMSVDNFTINSMLETPVSDNSSLLLAFRQTYRNLYNPKELQLAPNKKDRIEADITIMPDYTFRDMNLKYTFRNEKDIHVKFSFLTAQDKFSYKVDDMLTDWLQLIRNTQEASLQKGASLVIGKDSKKGMSARLHMSFSSLENKFDNQNSTINIFNYNTRNYARRETLNSTEELSLKLESKWAVNDIHQIEAGLSWISNSSSWHEDTSKINMFDQNIKGTHITFMAEDYITFKNFKLNTGIRLTRVPYLQKTFFEPRISASFSLSKSINLNLAGGLYRQFLTKNSVEDGYGNYRYMWILANETDYPVLRAKHASASLTLEQNNTQASITPFYKYTDGLTRYLNFSLRDIETLSNGHSRSYGLDFYLKQNFKGHTAWISYTLSQTEELFEHFPDHEYLYAPQDQRHELKLATLLNFDPIYFSANYVYGSGFPLIKISSNEVTYDRIPYKRLDLALTYKFNIKKIFGEAGLSILNLLDHENFLYNNLERVPTSQISSINIYQQSIPFTPTIYLKISF
ncbi:MAG: carboxypeptidase-like regulatory domain-containing protein [Thiohalospira sp.]